MESVGDLEWVVRVVGAGLPGALAVFEAVDGADLLLVAANDAYLSLFGERRPCVGDLVRSVLPGDDPQVARIVGGALDGDAFCAESWAIPAPTGTYSTGVAYCDWSLRGVDAYGSRALVLLLTDATRRTERSLSLAEEVVRLRDVVRPTTPA